MRSKTARTGRYVFWMDSFLQNAQRILEVARADEGGSNEDFALLIRPDGGLHFIMGSPISLEGAAACDEVRTAYHVTRSPGGVRVEGRTFGKSCVLEHRNAARGLLRDQVLYSTESGSGRLDYSGRVSLLIAGSAPAAGSGVCTSAAFGSGLAA